MLQDADDVGPGTTPGQALLQVSLFILDLPNELNWSTEKIMPAISFQDKLTLSGNFIQFKTRKT